ncbi:MAG: hypothetical protein IK081_08845 [Lachnospiraceae bacterium]|nr:hypothetical protein [Lachnospiraceae bacterium]
MKDYERKMELAFLEEEPLPEIVEKGMQDAYDLIYSQFGTGRRDRKEEEKKTSRPSGASLLKVAGFLAVCFVALGTTAFAVQALLGRYERMRTMDEEEKTQIYEELQKSGHLLYLSNRKWTEAEQKRYEELEQAYKNNEVLPERGLRRLTDGEEYFGVGVCLLATEQGEENLLYLPERDMTDEEILEIIEYCEKVHYVLREQNQKRQFGQEVWEERLSKMTDEEVDHYYLACFGATRSELFGGFCRDGQCSRTGAKVLSETEEKRYQEMNAAYRENNRIPEKEITLIEKPEDYDGKSVAYCRLDSVYYVPLGELTEEDFLEIIDFEARANYSCQRILEDVNYGKRSEFPVEETGKD